MNKKYVLPAVLVIGLLVLPQTTYAFSFKTFFSNVFGSSKTQTVQPASVIDSSVTDIVKPTTSDTQIIKTDGTLNTTVDTAPVKVPTTSPTVKTDVPIKQPTTVSTPPIKETGIVLKYGMRNSTNVQIVQKRLKVLGYLGGVADGNYGKGTVSAVSRFQKSKNISGDGMTIGSVTLKALGVTLLSPDKPIKPTITTSAEQILFMSGGEDPNSPTTARNDVYSSPDMFNWSLISPNDPNTTTKWSPRYHPETAYFSNKYWVIGDWAGGYQSAINDIWSSPDGINWTLINNNPPFKDYKEYRVTPFNGKLYVTGGYNFLSQPNGNVWSSVDGVTWANEIQNAPFGSIYRHMSFVFNNKIYVVGGGDFDNGQNPANFVYSSLDGINWIQENNNLPKINNGGKALVYQNKIYLIGPPETSVPMAGLVVWYSIDGNNWTVSNSPQINNWSAQFPDVVVAKGKMWFQNTNFTSLDNKLFSSVDGINWEEYCAALPWSPRYSHFNGMISNGGTPSNIPDPCQQTTPTLTISLSPNTPPAQTVQAGTVNVKLAEYNLTADDNAFSVSSLSFEVHQLNPTNPGAISNLKVLVDGVQIGSTITNPTVIPYNTSTNTFSGFNISFTAGVTKKISLYADVIPSAISGTNINAVFAGLAYLPIGGNVVYIPPLQSNTTTVVNQPSSTCTINSFTVPTSTTIASRVSVTTSWSSNCNSVALQANSGSYTLRYIGGSSGTHTFVAPTGTNFSLTDSNIDIALIVGNSTDTVSQVKSVPITDVTNPASNQCTFSSLNANPNPVPVGSNQTALSWITNAGCRVYVNAWKTDANGSLSVTNIFKPNTYYFDSTDSVTVNIDKSSTYYISAQAGAGNTTVLSAKTIDVKVQ